MEIRTAIEIGTIVFAVIGSWFVLKNNVDNLKNADEKLKEEDKCQWDQIEKLRQWVSVHEKDSALTRLDLEKEMSRIREDVNKTNGKMDTLISMIAELSKKLDKLEAKLETIKS